MANRYWVGNSGNWSDDDNHWATSSGGSAADGNKPTSSDNVYFDSNSGTGTVTVDEAASCLDFDMTGSTLTTIAGASALNVYGSITFVSGLTSSGFTDVIYLWSTSTETITTNGITLSPKLRISAAGSFTLQDAYTGTSSHILQVAGGGAIDLNDFDVSLGQILMTAGTISMGNGTITIAAGFTGAGVTAEGSTIVMTGTNTYFWGGSQTYNNVTLSGDGTFLKTGITCNTLTLNNAGGATGTRFQAGQTYTVTNFVTNGSAGNLVKLLSDSADTQFNLSKASGEVVEDYLHLTDSNATGGATWYAGANSTDNNNNDGWIFSGSSIQSLGFGDEGYIGS